MQVWSAQRLDLQQDYLGRDKVSLSRSFGSAYTRPRLEEISDNEKVFSLRIFTSSRTEIVRHLHHLELQPHRRSFKGLPKEQQAKRPLCPFSIRCVVESFRLKMVCDENVFIIPAF